MKFSFATFALISILATAACGNAQSAGHSAVAIVPTVQPGAAPFLQARGETRVDVVALVRAKECGCKR